MPTILVAVSGQLSVVAADRGFPCLQAPRDDRQLATDNGQLLLCRAGSFGSFRKVVSLAIQNSRDRAAHLLQLRAACIVQRHRIISESGRAREWTRGEKGKGASSPSPLLPFSPFSHSPALPLSSSGRIRAISVSSTLRFKQTRETARANTSSGRRRVAGPPSPL